MVEPGEQGISSEDLDSDKYVFREAWHTESRAWQRDLHCTLEK